MQETHDLIKQQSLAANHFCKQSYAALIDRFSTRFFIVMGLFLRKKIVHYESHALLYSFIKKFIIKNKWKNHSTETEQFQFSNERIQEIQVQKANNTSE